MQMLFGTSGRVKILAVSMKGILGATATAMAMAAWASHSFSSPPVQPKWASEIDSSRYHRSFRAELISSAASSNAYAVDVVEETQPSRAVGVPKRQPNPIHFVSQ